MSGLAGRNLLAVGGGSAIGFAAARIAAEAGARVLVAGIGEGAAEAVGAIAGETRCFRCDARDATDAEAAVAATTWRYGCLGALLTTVGRAAPRARGADERPLRCRSARPVPPPPPRRGVSSASPDSWSQRLRPGERASTTSRRVTDTPRSARHEQGRRRRRAVCTAMPIGETPMPEDCANVELFLLADAARAVTGQVAHLNGGLLMP